MPKVTVHEVILTFPRPPISNPSYFLAKAYKHLDADQKKVGFIVSDIKYFMLSREQKISNSSRIMTRLRIRKIEDNFEIKEDVENPTSGEKRSHQFQLNIATNQHVVLQGEPVLDVTERRFQSQIATVRWTEKELVITPLSEQNSFQCDVNQKAHKIEGTVM